VNEFTDTFPASRVKEGAMVFYSRQMGVDHKKAAELERLADESGLAIAIAGEGARQIEEFNNNSICRQLNPGESFAGACARFCGAALERTREAGKPVGFVCHAGLDCRAFLHKNGQGDKVVIVGRTFVRSENYRKATQRAVAGDWRSYSPSELFENVLLSGSTDVLDKTTRRAKDTFGERRPAGSAVVSPKPVSIPDVRDTSGDAPPSDLVRKFNKEVRGAEPPVTKATEPAAEIAVTKTEITPEPEQGRKAEARAWRSFFGSILRTDYARASRAILEFLAHHYGFTALVWLERANDKFLTKSSFGELSGRKVRLGLKPDDERLLDALNNETSLELGERAAVESSRKGRMMNLFPVGVGGEVSAAIAVLDPLDDVIQRKQIARMCHTLAPQMEILRLRDVVSGREALANAVKAFGDSLRTIDGEEFWQSVTQKAAEILRSERASLLVADETSGELEVKAMVGGPNQVPAGEKVGGRVARLVFDRNEPALVTDVRRTGLQPAPGNRHYRSTSFLSYPVTVGQRTIGVMSFTDRACGKPFDKHSLELFQAIAPQIAVAIDRANLAERAGAFEQLSVTDALTGLLNRRYIEERLLEEIKRSNREGFPMSFMMLDVDHFKSYNDEFGHPAGDEALRMVAAVLRDTLRGADVAARFGGEEFAVLLPQTTGPEAIAIAERIRSNLEQTDFPLRPVTASIGIASCSADLCSSESIVAAADKALYAAKRQGRNRVITFDEISGPQSRR
jgi:diguanylate cyclase (GGDEF)-like protein